jgi:uncharacterized protein (TIGR03084 family)
MAVDMDALVVDLAAETADLTRLLEEMGPAAWRFETPAAGWSVHDQVSHLAFFDQATTLALTEPARFRTEADALMASGPGFPDRVAVNHRELAVADLLSWFAEARRALLGVLTRTPPSRRMPWYGPDMSAASAVTARLMETWAHGQDIADTVGVTRTSTERLRHVAHLGVRTRGFSYALRDLAAPTGEVYVELVSPAGDPWTWGDPGSEQRVTGPAEDFCLVVTQRRHLHDTDLVADGSAAAEWLGIAQAFAGAPGPGRAPLTRPNH